MPQHNFSIANQTFPSFRADLNNALQALAGNSSGTTAPATPYPNQLWADTTAGQLKIRNNANSAWVILGRLDTIGFWLLTYAGNPNGNLAADFVGQLCLDSTNKLMYTATTAGSATTAYWDCAPFRANQTRHLAGFIPGQDTVVPGSRVNITAGSCTADNTTSMMRSNSSLAVDLTQSGANGLDTGSKTANTTYYLWIIGKPDGTVAGIFTANVSVPSPMPSGYTLRRQLPIAYRTDSTNTLINQRVWGGWPNRPHIVYTDPQATNCLLLNNGTATTYTTVDASSVVPIISRALFATMRLASCYVWTRPNGTSNAGIQTGVNTGSGDNYMNAIPIDLNGSQEFQYRVSLANCSIWAQGYIITDI